MFLTFSYKAKNAFIHIAIKNRIETVEIQLDDIRQKVKSVTAAKKRISELLKNAQ